MLTYLVAHHGGRRAGCRLGRAAAVAGRRPDLAALRRPRRLDVRHDGLRRGSDSSRAATSSTTSRPTRRGAATSAARWARLVVGAATGRVRRPADRRPGARCVVGLTAPVGRCGGVDGQARGRRQGLGHARPGSRRAPRPRSTHSSFVAPVAMDVPGARHTLPGLGERASASWARPGRSAPGAGRAGRARRTLRDRRAGGGGPDADWPRRPGGGGTGRACTSLPRQARRRAALEDLATRDRRRPGGRGHRRHGQPAAGARRARRRQGRGDRQQGDAGGRRPPGHAAGARLAAARRAAEPADPMPARSAWLRPIDSEHSAIWQCLAGEQMATVGAADPDRVRRSVPRRGRRSAWRRRRPPTRWRTRRGAWAPRSPSTRRR